MSVLSLPALLALARPISALSTENLTSFIVIESKTYQIYKGNGTPAAGWPKQSAWTAFEAAFAANTPTMLLFDSPTEVSHIKSSILSVSSNTSVEALFILAIIMQESRGNVRVTTTFVDIANPGLMQSHEGVNCMWQTPCPKSVIRQMIQDGTGGTATGHGLQQALTKANASDVSRFYRAARIYNSGSLGWGDLADGAATPCYASDIANRMGGFLGDRPRDVVC